MSLEITVKIIKFKVLRELNQIIISFAVWEGTFGTIFDI